MQQSAKPEGRERTLVLSELPKAYSEVSALLGQQRIAKEIAVFDFLLQKRKDSSMQVRLPKLKFLKDYRLVIFVPNRKKIFLESNGLTMHKQIANNAGLNTNVSFKQGLPYMSGDSFVLRANQQIRLVRLDYLHEPGKIHEDTRNGLKMSLPTKESIIALRDEGILLLDLAYNWIIESEKQPKGFSYIPSGIASVEQLELYDATKRYWKWK